MQRIDPNWDYSIKWNRRQQKRTKKLAKQQRRSNIKSIRLIVQCVSRRVGL